jgi:hypothetical protein
VAKKQGFIRVLLSFIGKHSVEDLDREGLGMRRGPGRPPASSPAVAWPSPPPARPEAAQAFPTGDRVQPRRSSGVLGEIAHCYGGDDEGVPQRLGCVRRLAQQTLTVVVEGSGVLVIRYGDARRVICRDRRNRLAVVYGPHGS